jgi:hypothetical protein
VRGVPPDRMSESAETLGRISNDETLQPFEAVCICKDGRRIDVSLAVSAVKDGGHISASKIARDITELRLRPYRAGRWCSECSERPESLHVVPCRVAWCVDFSGNPF